MMRWLPAAALVLSASMSLAQEQPVVRVDVSTESVAVGESVEVRITILVPTWFPKPPTYPDFELANAITRLPPDSSFPTSERVGGDTWSGIVRKYRVYPLVGATYRIVDETVGVTWANPGADPFAASIPVPGIVFRGTVPEGAEQLDPYVAGRALSLSLDVSGELDRLEAGDALVLTWTAELDGLPAIFLPPLAPEIDFPGVSVYAENPVVEDGPPARRSEKVTLVFEAGGGFSVPPVELDYWNTEAGRIETASAEGIAVSVAGPLPAPAPADTRDEPVDWRRIMSIAAAVLLLAAVLAAALPRLAARARARAEQRERSEHHAYRQLREALRSGRSRMAYEKLLAWTERLEPPMDSRAFARRFGDDALLAGIDGLSASIYGGDVSQTDLHALSTSLAEARRAWTRRTEARGNVALPPLNP